MDLTRTIPADYTGEYKILFENNNTPKFILRYKNGQLNGGQKEFYENGNLKEKSVYKDDKQHGKMITYNIDGNIEKIKIYKEGFESGNTISYYPNNQIQTQYKSFHKNGDDYSKVIEYYENGNKKESYTSIITEDFNYLEGAYEKYYENGVLQEKYYYHQNEKHGHCISYYPSGNVKRTERYENGELKIGISHEDGHFEKWRKNMDEKMLERKQTQKLAERKKEYQHKKIEVGKKEKNKLKREIENKNSSKEEKLEDIEFNL